MSRLLQFDPVGNFQRAKSNRLAIEQQQQNIDAQPRRNQLLDLQIAQGQQGLDLGSQRLDLGNQTQQLNQLKIDQAQEVADIRKMLQVTSEIEPLVMSGNAQGAMDYLNSTLDPESAQFASQFLNPESFQQAKASIFDHAAKLGVIKQEAQPKPDATIARAQFAFPDDEAAQRSAVAGTLKPKAPISVNQSVNSAPNFKIPNDHMLKDFNDPSQGVIPIPGSPTDVAQREQAEKEANKERDTRRQAVIISSDIGLALEQAKDAFSTGFAGAIVSAVPGTRAHDLKRNLDGVKANVGFDKLQSMRENSPTGGALGQVSENENRLLQSVFGSVEQSQSEEQLTRNLKRLQVLFDAVVHGTQPIPFTQQDFDQIPSGSTYISPDTGQLMRKQ